MLGFENLRILDISTIIAGPFASLNFAKRGSEVIHLELPDVGDGARNLGTVAEAAGGWFKFLSQDKLHASLRLSVTEGAELFKILVAESDILIENFRPGTLERWGLGPSVLESTNPRLIMIRISGFGQWGPNSHRPGYGTLAEAMSTFPFVTGQADGPPTLPGTALADTFAGYAAYSAALEGLFRREQSPLDVGFQCIDVPLYGAMTFAMGLHAAEYGVTGHSPQRRGNRLGNAPRNAVLSSDGQWIVYSAQSNNIVKSIIALLGVSHEQKFLEDQAGYKYGEELDKLISEWVSQHTAEDVLNAFDAHGIPSGPIYNAEQLVSDAHLIARGDIEEVRDSETNAMLRLPGLPYRFDDEEVRAESVTSVTGGSIGQDNHDVYTRLAGLSENDIEALESTGII